MHSCREEFYAFPSRLWKHSSTSDESKFLKSENSKYRKFKLISRSKHSKRETVLLNQIKRLIDITVCFCVIKTGDSFIQYGSTKGF